MNQEKAAARRRKTRAVHLRRVEDGGHYYPRDGSQYCRRGCGAWFSPSGLPGYQPEGIDPLGHCPGWKKWTARTGWNLPPKED